MIYNCRRCIIKLKDGFSAVRFDGDYGFDLFLEQNGTSSDAEVIAFLAENLIGDIEMGSMLAGGFGCSTIAVPSDNLDALFGRNFDWQNCEAMVVESYPTNGYASISIVNMDFITQNTGGFLSQALKLLGEYDLHSSMGLVVHFAIADSSGSSVVVE